MDTKNKLAAVNEYLKSGVYPTSYVDTDFHIFDYFMEQGEMQVITDLVNKTDNPNCYNSNGYSLLELAVDKEAVAVVEALFLKGADPQKYDWELTVFRQALEKRNEDIIKLFLKYCPDAKNISLAYFIGSGNFTVLNFIIKSGLIKTDALLHAACAKYRQHKNLELIRLIIENNEASLFAKDVFDETPLFGAEFPEVIDLLLKYGANVNHQKRNGMTVLHYLLWRSIWGLEGLESEVQEKNKLDCVKVLLKYGADPTISDNSGKTVIHHVTETWNVEMLKLILKNVKIDINELRDMRGCTPLHYIRTKYNKMDQGRLGVNRVADILLHYGGSLKVRNRYEETPLDERRISNNVLAFTKAHITYHEKVALLGVDVTTDTKLKNDQEISEKYGKELNKLQTIVVCTYPKITLRDVLFLKPRKMVKYARNKDLLEWFNADEGFEKDFPHYGLMLNYRMRNAVARRKLVDQAINILRLVLGTSLPTIFSEKIFGYFDEWHLEHFIDDRENSLSTLLDRMKI